MKRVSLFFILCFFMFSGGAISAPRLFFTFGATVPHKNTIQVDESLYHAMTVAPNDAATERMFIERFKGQLKKGTHLFLVRNVPVITTFLCGQPVEQIHSKHYFFTSKGVPCARKAQFFPGKDAWEFDALSPITADKPFTFVREGSHYLIYRADISFAPYVTVDGTIVTVHEDGRITNELNKPLYPTFLHTPEGWQQVIPLRESFDLQVSEKGLFTLSIFSERNIPSETEALKDTINIRCGKIAEISTNEPNKTVIQGSNFMGVSTPLLVRSSTNDRGRYHISLSIPNRSFHCAPHQPKTNRLHCVCSAKPNTLIVDCSITEDTLSSNETISLQRWMKQTIPPFIVYSEDRK